MTTEVSFEGVKKLQTRNHIEFALELSLHISPAEEGKL